MMGSKQFVKICFTKAVVPLGAERDYCGSVSIKHGERIGPGAMRQLPSMKGPSSSPQQPGACQRIPVSSQWLCVTSPAVGSTAAGPAIVGMAQREQKEKGGGERKGWGRELKRLVVIKAAEVIVLGDNCAVSELLECGLLIEELQGNWVGLAPCKLARLPLHALCSLTPTRHKYTQCPYAHMEATRHTHHHLATCADTRRHLPADTDMNANTDMHILKQMNTQRDIHTLTGTHRLMYRHLPVDTDLCVETRKHRHMHAHIHRKIYQTDISESTHVNVPRHDSTHKPTPTGRYTGAQ